MAREERMRDMQFQPELFLNNMGGTVPGELSCSYKGHKIFAFSDTHGMYRRLTIPADADILICAGDACEGFNPADLQDFFAWYISIPAELRIFVAGNHDRIFDQEPIHARELIPGSVVYLENGGFEFDGIRFYSVPARPYLKTPVTIPAEVDFLITHGPAYSYLDRELGCKQLFLSIASARPKYHIFGHIHEEGLQRKAMLGGTTFLNVSHFVSCHSLAFSGRIFAA